MRLQPTFISASLTHRWIICLERTIGRDHLVRLLYGGRVSLTVGLIAALFSAVIGTIIGICAGYYGGRLDSFLMRITDSVIALPLLPS